VEDLTALLAYVKVRSLTACMHACMLHVLADQRATTAFAEFGLTCNDTDVLQTEVVVENSPF
jgi:hypothetical protein